MNAIDKLKEDIKKSRSIESHTVSEVETPSGGIESYKITALSGIYYHENDVMQAIDEYAQQQKKEAEIDRLIADGDNQFLMALQLENKELKNMLKRLEWRVVAEWGNNRRCPFCQNLKTEGHHLNCELAKLLEGGENGE